MRELSAFVLVVAGIVSYFLLATRLDFYQRWPLVHFAIVLAGLAVGVLAWRARSTRRGKTMASLVLGVCGFLSGSFLWYIASYSNYEGDAGLTTGTSVRAELANVELPDANGGTTPLWRSDDRGTLLVFYRGFW